MATQITKAKFKTELSKKLGDISNVYWTDTELNLALEESLLTFGAISNYWKSQLGFKTIVGTSFYDASSLENLTFDYSYGDILRWINFFLRENISTIFPNSEMFSLEKILSTIDQLIIEIQLRTGLINKTKVLDALTYLDENFLKIPQDVLDIQRLSFKPYSSFDENLIESIEVYRKLKEEDEEKLQSFYRTFHIEPAIPKYFSSILHSSNLVTIYPPPINKGDFHLVYLLGIDKEVLSTVNTKVSLPNVFIPYLKWGVISKLLESDGLGNDIQRSLYAKSRFEEGISIAKTFTSIIYLTINGIPTKLDSMEGFDNFAPDWQNNSGKVSRIGMVGNNLLVTNKVPNDIYSLDFTTIINPPIPELNTDFIDLRVEYLEPLLDYCFHILKFKDGITDIQETNNLKEEFIKIAFSHNLRLQARGISYEELIQKSKWQEIRNPRISRPLELASR